ncbi:MAG: hypothetical protein ACYDHT_13750, partial [Solirubrobacteraceae bacterium]
RQTTLIFKSFNKGDENWDPISFNLEDRDSPSISLGDDGLAISSAFSKRWSANDIVSDCDALRRAATSRGANSGVLEGSTLLSDLNAGELRCGPP